MKTLIIIVFLFIISLGAMAAPKDKALTDFFKEKTKIDNPLELRDPFKAPFAKSGESGKRKGFTITGKGTYSNINEANLGALSIQEMKVVGVLIGKERRALIVPNEGSKVVILKEGAKIGVDGAELKAILPGGIILVEKIVNVYGQEEYLETVIPISR